MKSPLFKAEGLKHKAKTLVIKDEDEISKIGYRSNYDGSKETMGIKFEDSDGQEIDSWDTGVYSWRYVDVLADENVIGVSFLIKNLGDTSYIMSLRFKTISIGC